MSKIKDGDVVLLVLHTPREKCWGVLGEVNAAGVFIRGIDLNSFDDWVHAIANDEGFFGLTDQFFPMWRVEKMSRDESTEGILSLAEQFEQRTGKKIEEF
jgi:hypothetical protein